MAITRAQQAKQMLQNGGRIGFFKGAQADASAGKGAMSPGTSMSGGGRDRGGSDFGQFERRQQQNQALEGKGFLGKDLGMNIGEQDRLAKFGDFIKGGGIIGNVLSGIFSGGTGKVKPPLFQGGGGGGNQTIPYWAQLGFSSEEEYLASLRAQAPSTEEQEPEEPFQLARRFRAEGGIMNADVVGGEFDFESARQMYGLGKLVKKVTRTVKKIAKSPVGKAAIIGLGAYYAPGFGIKAQGGLAPFLQSAKTGIGNFFLGMPGDTAGRVAGTGLFSKIPGGGVTAAIAGTSLLAGLLTPKQEAQAQALANDEGIDIEAARRSILNAGTSKDFRARAFVAEGGSMKEPVAKKTMPLLDMGGQEMDLRAEGGFVPIGRMEKADDVPARLSKNEFVFTAEAVRNAGEGDVDKGAEVMYNMMKNLEAGGEVSEESQGLEGARKMFQTSQRLEEVL